VDRFGAWSRDWRCQGLIEHCSFSTSRNMVCFYSEQGRPTPICGRTLDLRRLAYRRSHRPLLADHCRACRIRCSHFRISRLHYHPVVRHAADRPHQHPRRRSQTPDLIATRVGFSRPFESFEGKYTRIRCSGIPKSHLHDHSTVSAHCAAR
jgi:hypothetical protein